MTTSPRWTAIVLAAALLAAPAATASGGEGQPPTAAQQDGPNKVDAGGWARTSVEAVARTPEQDGPAGDRAGVPHDRLIARNLLNLRTRYSRARWFEAAGTVLLTYDLFKPERSTPTHSPSLRTDVRGEVREAYVGLFATSVDVRVGMQRIAWGHADAFAPNDVVNANDFRDPILTETELRYRPTFAVRVDVERSFGTLQIVARPVLRPDRYDVYGTNWAFVQPDAPAGYRGALGVLAQRPETSLQDAGAMLLVDGNRPSGLEAWQSGVRFDWRLGPFDVTHYYDHGYHGTPAFRITEPTVALLNATDWTRVSRDDILSLLSVAGAADAIDSTWERRQHVGLDLGTTKGPLALRADVAYQHPALFYDRTFNGWLSPAIQAVFGAELQTGALGRTVLVEGRYRRIQHDLPPGGLLFAARDALDAAVLVRWTLGNRLELEARGTAGLSPRSYVLRPQIGWKRDAMALRLGVLLLGGEPGSFGDWYTRNRSVYLMFRRAL